MDKSPTNSDTGDTSSDAKPLKKTQVVSEPEIRQRLQNASVELQENDPYSVSFAVLESDINTDTVTSLDLDFVSDHITHTTTTLSSTSSMGSKGSWQRKITESLDMQTHNLVIRLNYRNTIAKAISVRLDEWIYDIRRTDAFGYASIVATIAVTISYILSPYYGWNVTSVWMISALFLILLSIIEMGSFNVTMFRYLIRNDYGFWYQIYIAISMNIYLIIVDCKTLSSFTSHDIARHTTNMLFWVTITTLFASNDCWYIRTKAKSFFIISALLGIIATYVYNLFVGQSAYTAVHLSRTETEHISWVDESRTTISTLAIFFLRGLIRNKTGLQANIPVRCKWIYYRSSKTYAPKTPVRAIGRRDSKESIGSSSSGLPSIAQSNSTATQYILEQIRGYSIALERSDTVAAAINVEFHNYLFVIARHKWFAIVAYTASVFGFVSFVLSLMFPHNVPLLVIYAVLICVKSITFLVSIFLCNNTALVYVFHDFESWWKLGNLLISAVMLSIAEYQYSNDTLMTIRLIFLHSILLLAFCLVCFDKAWQMSSTGKIVFILLFVSWLLFLNFYTIFYFNGKIVSQLKIGILPTTYINCLEIFKTALLNVIIFICCQCYLIYRHPNCIMGGLDITRVWTTEGH